MESTGVYWIPLFELLESRGFMVYLVNARHVKNVSGRKSDVLDCQWLQQLMSFGLLSGAFRPQGEICALRSVARQRAMLLSYQARHVQHMQKALTQMNIQLAQVISDVVGETGQRIIRAILAGERNGQVLAKLKHFRIRATEGEIAKALQGNWREEHLFALKQAVSLYDAYATELAECDRQLESMLAGAPWQSTGQSETTGAGEERTPVRHADLSVSVVRGGFDPDRWNRRHHRLQGIGRSGRRSVALQNREALRLLAGVVSGNEDIGRKDLVGCL